MTPPGSSPSADSLDVDLFVERIAQRTAVLVLDKLARRVDARPGGWRTAAEVAAHLQIDTEWVTSHGEALGGVRLGEVGEGKRPRWRFPPLERIDELLASCPGGRESGGSRSRTAAGKSRRRATRSSGSGVPLLPVHDRKDSR